MSHISGLNFIKRKLAKQVPCSSELTKTGDNEYCFITHMPFNTLQQKFMPDVPFDQETADGRKVKNIFSFDGDNKMTEKQIEPNREVIITRTFTEKEMLGYATVKDVKCQMWSEFVEK